MYHSPLYTKNDRVIKYTSKYMHWTNHPSPSSSTNFYMKDCICIRMKSMQPGKILLEFHIQLLHTSKTNSANSVSYINVAPQGVQLLYISITQYALFSVQNSILSAFFFNLSIMEVANRISVFTLISTIISSLHLIVLFQLQKKRSIFCHQNTTFLLGDTYLREASPSKLCIVSVC